MRAAHAVGFAAWALDAVAFVAADPSQKEKAADARRHQRLWKD
jgi:hypothetical protein